MSAGRHEGLLKERVNDRINDRDRVLAQFKHSRRNLLEGIPDADWQALIAVFMDRAEKALDTHRAIEEIENAKQAVKKLPEEEQNEGSATIYEGAARRLQRSANINKEDVLKAYDKMVLDLSSSPYAQCKAYRSRGIFAARRLDFGAAKEAYDCALKLLENPLVEEGISNLEIAFTRYDLRIKRAEAALCTNKAMRESGENKTVTMMKIFQEYKEILSSGFELELKSVTVPKAQLQISEPQEHRLTLYKITYLDNEDNAKTTPVNNYLMYGCFHEASSDEYKWQFVKLDPDIKFSELEEVTFHPEGTVVLVNQRGDVYRNLCSLNGLPIPPEDVVTLISKMAPMLDDISSSEEVYQYLSEIDPRNKLDYLERRLKARFRLWRKDKFYEEKERLLNEQAETSSEDDLTSRFKLAIEWISLVQGLNNQLVEDTDQGEKVEKEKFKQEVEELSNLGLAKSVAALKRIKEIWLSLNDFSKGIEKQIVLEKGEFLFKCEFENKTENKISLLKRILKKSEIFAFELRYLIDYFNGLGSDLETNPVAKVDKDAYFTLIIAAAITSNDKKYAMRILSVENCEKRGNKSGSAITKLFGFFGGSKLETPQECARQSIVLSQVQKIKKYISAHFPDPIDARSEPKQAVVAEKKPSPRSGSFISAPAAMPKLWLPGMGSGKGLSVDCSEIDLQRDIDSLRSGSDCSPHNTSPHQQSPTSSGRGGIG